MEIKIQIAGRVYSISLGYKTAWFENMSFLTIIEECHDEKRAVINARMIFRS